MFWVNGVKQDMISLTDRSFQYGDGCFTTLMTEEGKPLLWMMHQERIEACLNVLGIEHPDWSLLLQWIEQAALPSGKAGVKVHISRGEGGRGYSPTQVGPSNVTISTFALPEQYSAWRKEGVKLGVSQVKLGLNPILAGHKHNNRLEQVLAKADIEKQSLVDGIVLDINGNVIESTIANIFWVIGDTLYTPDLTLSGVAGVARRSVLEVAEKTSQAVEVGQYRLEALMKADEVFICNSLMGIVPVTRIADQEFKIGPLTKRYQEKVNT
ncbi:aminodeoxychorismate lyase [Vibrio mexicanus]|uniref:aminodeoxychorismate lyase n=1 Tax=Vibrio mexicanus TaxID=1004326 RepID=UPI00063BF8B4|nr:aminodeoxychorismate lyase [Vibrio mexicanus]